RSLTKGVCIKSLTMRTSGEMKLGHCDFQIRTEASELGHYRVAACGDACVLYAAERAGNALYGARVDLEFGRRLAHAHAPRQSRPDSFSYLIRDFVADRRCVGWRQ